MDAPTKLATLPRRMSRHLPVGVQALERSADLPHLRFHVEAKRGQLVLSIQPPLAANESIQWIQGGTSIPGANSPTLVLGEMTAADSDVYRAEISQDDRTVATQTCLVVVVPGFRLVDQSARGFVTPDHPLIVGFVIGRASESATPKTFLVRVVGASLSRLGIESGLQDYRVSLFRRDKACDHLLREDAEFVAIWSPKVGAFALDDEASEFVRVGDLPAGHYTLHVASQQGASGDVLVELYETAANT
ncbi:MAG: hypothetical protein SynsKO_45000 [Synoicihabitans sp.]